MSWPPFLSRESPFWAEFQGELGLDFFEKVYNITAQIPAGKVATYGQIAALAGKPRGARTVGWAMHSVPAELDLPCHRVVSKSGQLAPGYVFGGYEVQRAELEAEGVVFARDGRIDMQRCLWSPETEVLDLDVEELEDGP